MLRIAARYADGWSSWGGYEVHTEQDFYAVTAERTWRFDDLCADLGRSPTEIRHSVVCFPPLTPWESVDYFVDMVGRLRESGTDEFVLYWPQSWRQQPSELRVFEEVANTTIPALRATG
jgi:alkanesulfonate monooxygenase SsuD/methylene tetrahydromethanopterin reductase-like flavin-dependent oxidoreductase (luciferase family)